MIFAILLAAAAAVADPSKCPHNWTYQNQGAWGGECRTGEHQSPIDLSSARDNTRLQPIVFEYAGFPLSVLNNEFYYQVPNAQNCKVKLKINGVEHEYTLDQFHFHVPAEHTGGAAHAAEMHLVHKRGKEIVVVGVLFSEQKKANAALEPIVRLGRIKPACNTQTSRELFNPESLLPPRGYRKYIHYVGSLTTPDCDPNVQFYMMVTPVPASHEQLQKLGELGPSNRHPPRLLNGRVPQRSTH